MEKSAAVTTLTPFYCRHWSEPPYTNARIRKKIKKEQKKEEKKEKEREEEIIK